MKTQDISAGKAHSDFLVLPNDTNHYGNLFGGTLLALMDRTAFIAARRYSEGDLVTVSVENVVFASPLRLGESAVINAEVSKVGKTSVETTVNVFSGEKVVIKDAYFTFVNVDKAGKPLAVPQPEFGSPEEKARYNEHSRVRTLQKECLLKAKAI